MKCFHCFGAGMMSYCNLHSLTFLRKSSVLPSIFLHCFNAKKNASALEFPEEIIRPSSKIIFSTQQSTHCCWLLAKKAYLCKLKLLRFFSLQIIILGSSPRPLLT